MRNRPYGSLTTWRQDAASRLSACRVDFVVKPTTALFGTLLRCGLREPRYAAQSILTSALRTVRQLVAAQGASFLGRGG